MRSLLAMIQLKRLAFCLLTFLTLSSCQGLISGRDSEVELWDWPSRPPGKPPTPGTLPGQTARALYSNQTFFGMRGSISKAEMEYLSPCFTPSLLRHFVKCRRAVSVWFRKHKGDNMKLPLGEGPVFLSVWEHPQRFHVGEPQVNGDRAVVPVQLTLLGYGPPSSWIDEALFVRRGGKWLLDDIRFDKGEQGTLRERMTLKD